jgi:hypothetical protein
MVGCGMACQGKVGFGPARHGKVRQGTARLAEVGLGVPRCDWARRGMAWLIFRGGLYAQKYWKWRHGRDGR